MRKHFNSLDDFLKQHIPLLRNTFFLSLDIIPMLFIYSLTAYLTGQTNHNTTQDENNSYAAQMGIFFVNTISSFFLLRQQTRFDVHTLVLSLTNTAETKSEFSTCKTNHCTSARYFKRNLYDVMLFLAQLMAISALKLIPYIGFVTATLSRMLLTAQVAASYVLAERKVCGYHREIYYLEYYPFFFTVGFLHYAASFSVAKQFEYIPGVHREQMEPIVSAILSLYLVEFLRHINMPEPVSETKSRWYDPLTITRQTLSSAMDFIIPSVKNYVNEIAKRKKEKTWVMIRNSGTAILQHKHIQSIAKLKYIKYFISYITPIIQKDFHNLMQDPIMSAYWPRISENIVYSLEQLLRLRPRILQFVRAMELYQANAETVKGVVGVASTMLSVAAPYTLLLALLKPLTIAVGIENGARFLGKQSQLFSEIKQLLHGIPKGVIDMMIGALKDEAFVTDAEKLSHHLKGMLEKYYDKKTNQCAWIESETSWNNFEKLLNQFSLVEKPDDNSTDELVKRCEFPKRSSKSDVDLCDQPAANGGKIPTVDSKEWDDTIPKGNSVQFMQEYVGRHLPKKQSAASGKTNTAPNFTASSHAI